MKRRGQFMVLTVILVAFVLVSASAVLSDFEEEEYGVHDDAYVIEMVQDEARQININDQSDIESFKRQVSMIPTYTSSAEFDPAEGCFRVELRTPSDDIYFDCLEGYEGINLVAEPIIAGPGEEIEFRVEGYDEDAEEFEWDLDDGTVEVTDEETFEYAYSSQGQYDPSVTVISPEQEVMESTTVTIDTDLGVQINVEGETFQTGEEIDFVADTTSDGEIEEYSWDFDDATFESGDDLDEISHTYDDPGQYDVEVTVEDEFEEEASDEITLDIEEDTSTLFADDEDDEWEEVTPEEGGEVEIREDHLYVEANAEGDDVYSNDVSSASRYIETEEEIDMSGYDTLYADYQLNVSRRDDDDGNDETGRLDMRVDRGSEGEDTDSVDISDDHDAEGHDDKRTAVRSGTLEIDISNLETEEHVKFHSRAHSSNSGLTKSEISEVWME